MTKKEFLDKLKEYSNPFLLDKVQAQNFIKEFSKQIPEQFKDHLDFFIGKSYFFGYIYDKNIEKAKSYLISSLSSTHEQNGYACLYLGEIYLIENNPNQAIKNFEKAGSYSEIEDKALLGMTSAYIDIDPKKSLKMFNKINVTKLDYHELRKYGQIQLVFNKGLDKLSLFASSKKRSIECTTQSSHKKIKPEYKESIDDLAKGFGEIKLKRQPSSLDNV